jgi:hypothetical protein
MGPTKERPAVELERGRLIEAGRPADRESFVEPRDTRKTQRAQEVCFA